MKVLFLGYDENRTRLIDLLSANGCAVDHAEDPVTDFGGYDLALSFGYRHILKPDALQTAKREVLNLHIGYLPYNRGAHPNFWSFFEGTPAGVTIHAIDEGVDTGPVAFQRLVNFDRGENTFAETHARLIAEIESLFEENIQSILSGDFALGPQRGRGSQHLVKDLPVEFAGWDAEIGTEIRRLDGLLGDPIEEKLKLIDEIEKVRRNNNVNWMDLLRLAYRVAPDNAAQLVRKINSDDMKISELFKKLGA